MAILNLYTGKLDFLNTSNTIFIDPAAFDKDYSTYELIHTDQHKYTYTLDYDI